MIVPERLKALVVDDNAYARSAAAASLRKLGIGKIVEASGGAAALPILMSEPIDVMLLDWFMPEVSGAGVMQIIRDPRIGRLVGLPVIMITGYPSRENTNRARDLGVNEILTKPFSTDQLMLALGKVLRSGWDEAGEPVPRTAAAAGKFFL